MFKLSTYSKYFQFSPAELEKHGRSAFILLAMAAITYALVGVFYNVLSLKLSGTRPVKPAVQAAAPLEAAPKQPVESYALIYQRNLFGSTEKIITEKAAAPVPVVPQLPELSSLIELKGTIAGTGLDGFAVIEERGKNKQVLYKVGNTVVGAKLIHIARNAVTFLYGDQQKILKMLDTKGPLLPPRPGPATAPPVASRGGGPLVISRNEVESSLKDMGTLLSSAQIRPYYTDGAPDGFLISNIRPGSVYEKIGLVNGDIIQGTDDRKLTSAEDVTAFYNSLKSGTSFSLKIKRNGQPESLQFHFR